MMPRDAPRATATVVKVLDFVWLEDSDNGEDVNDDGEDDDGGPGDDNDDGSEDWLDVLEDIDNGSKDPNNDCEDAGDKEGCPLDGNGKPGNDCDVCDGDIGGVSEESGTV